MWCVPELNDDYIGCMEDTLQTYERPYDAAQPVVCLDEKPVTLHAEVRPASPAVPGREARADSEYERRGTANVFCAVEPKAGATSRLLRQTDRGASSPKYFSIWRWLIRRQRRST